MEREKQKKEKAETGKKGQQLSKGGIKLKTEENGGAGGQRIRKSRQAENAGSQKEGEEKNSYRYLEVGKRTNGNGTAEMRSDAKTKSWKSEKWGRKQKKGEQNYDYLRAGKVENE